MTKNKKGKNLLPTNAMLANRCFGEDKIHYCKRPKYWDIRKGGKFSWLDIGWHTVRIKYCPFCGIRLK